MAPSSSSSSSSSSPLSSPPPRRVLLLDVMGTIVRDPFYEDIPRFFNMSMKELLSVKHPTAWIDFESGLISEEQLLGIFFADGRHFDMPGLKRCMRDGYEFLDGMEALLLRLKGLNVEMHAFTNYPSWYSLIEDKLQLSRYVPWTFVSCHMGLRKPDAKIYLEAARQLGGPTSDFIFVDDRLANVEASRSVGMVGVHFRDSTQLAKDLSFFLEQEDFHEPR